MIARASLRLARIADKVGIRLNEYPTSKQGLVGDGMNGICSCLGYLTPYCFMDSIIQTLRCLLNVLLNVGKASLNLFPITARGHTMPVVGFGMGFYTDRAAGCHSQYLGVVRMK